MATDHFCLKWNNFHNSILSAFESLQSSEDLVDVTLMCEGRNVKAHKIILSACSPYFRNLFKETPCQHPIIILKDVLHCDLVAILQFMYQGEVLISQDGLSSFLKTAELLQVSGLAGNTPGAHTQESAIIPAKCKQPAPPLVPVPVSSPPSPATTSIVNKLTDSVVTKQVEKENLLKTDEKSQARIELIEEPIQSCSYQSPERVIVKTESEDQDFEEMEYSLLSQDISDNPGPTTEEESILERSLKAQGEQHGRRLQKKSKKDPPANCPHCYLRLSRASNLKRHFMFCKALKKISVTTISSSFGITQKTTASPSTFSEKSISTHQIRRLRSRRTSSPSLDESNLNERNPTTVAKIQIPRRKSTALSGYFSTLIEDKLGVLTDLTISKQEIPMTDVTSTTRYSTASFDCDSNTKEDIQTVQARSVRRMSRLNSAKKRNDEFEYY